MDYEVPTVAADNTAATKAATAGPERASSQFAPSQAPAGPAMTPPPQALTTAGRTTLIEDSTTTQLPVLAALPMEIDTRETPAGQESHAAVGEAHAPGHEHEHVSEARKITTDASSIQPDLDQDVIMDDAGEEKVESSAVRVGDSKRAGPSRFPAQDLDEGAVVSEQALKDHPAANDDQAPDDEDKTLLGYQHDGGGSDASSFSAAQALDVDTGDSDSAIGRMDVLSSTQSARSSIYDFVEENGRKYHRFREGHYHLPNDEIEQDRLDLQHHLFQLTLGKLYLAPIKDLPGGLHHVLDIATGTGIWAIDFATEFPQTAVLGMDLSPIQPDFVPANCQFEIDDADDEWIYSHQFDYIHGRALTACFKSHRKVYKSAFKFTRPGGYFEVQDVACPVRAIDNTLSGSKFDKWQRLTLAGAAALGRDFTQVPKYKTYLEEAGFVDVVEKRFVWPLGTWAKGAKMKALGRWAQEDVLSAMQGGSMAVLTRGLGMTTDEVELSIAGAREDLKSNKIHMYMAIYVVYGRKPE